MEPVRDHRPGQHGPTALNGLVVIPGARIPDPALGTDRLQHHGGKPHGQWAGPPSLVQYKNIFIKELAGAVRAKGCAVSYHWARL